jgi:hypothetical protein
LGHFLGRRTAVLDKVYKLGKVDRVRERDQLAF